MFSEKLKKMFSKNDGNNKKKIENILVFIVILAITIVAINYIWNGDESSKSSNEVPEAENTNSVVQVSTDTSNDQNEEKLANILSNIEGVGKVKVLLTYSQTSTYVPIYNENLKESNTTETDSAGGSRTVEESDSQKEVIYKEDGNGNREPVTQSIISPKIEGAIITAEGANNADVKTAIVQAVEAATGLATHKIQVFKMSEWVKIQFFFNLEKKEEGYD